VLSDEQPWVLREVTAQLASGGERAASRTQFIALERKIRALADLTRAIAERQAQGKPMRKTEAVARLSQGGFTRQEARTFLQKGDGKRWRLEPTRKGSGRQRAYRVLPLDEPGTMAPEPRCAGESSTGRVVGHGNSGGKGRETRLPSEVVVAAALGAGGNDPEYHRSVRLPSGGLAPVRAATCSGGFVSEKFCFIIRPLYPRQRRTAVGSLPRPWIGAATKGLPATRTWSRLQGGAGRRHRSEYSDLTHSGSPSLNITARIGRRRLPRVVAVAHTRAHHT
jgi:hypothetical protein